MRHRASFALIYQTVVEMWAFFDFSIWRPSAVLDLLYACLDHPRRVGLFGGLCDRAKFRWKRCSRFDNMQVLIF